MKFKLIKFSFNKIVILMKAINIICFYNTDLAYDLK